MPFKIISFLLVHFFWCCIAFGVGLVFLCLIILSPTPQILNFMEYEIKSITFDFAKWHGIGALVSDAIISGILSIVDTCKYAKCGYFKRDYF
jgi:hypothetical protein